MAEQVGVIGLRSMGQPMTRNLSRAGYHLVVCEGARRSAPFGPADTAGRMGRSYDREPPPAWGLIAGL